MKANSLVVVRSANAVGKDWIAEGLALWWVYAHGGLALVTGPTERQVREVVMGEVVTAFAKARDLPGELSRKGLLSAEGGDVIELVQRVRGCSFAEAVRELAA